MSDTEDTKAAKKWAALSIWAMLGEWSGWTLLEVLTSLTTLETMNPNLRLSTGTPSKESLTSEFLRYSKVNRTLIKDSLSKLTLTWTYQTLKERKPRLGGEARPFHYSIYTDIYESFILSRVAIESIFYKDEIGLKLDYLN